MLLYVAIFYLLFVALEVTYKQRIGSNIYEPCISFSPMIRSFSIKLAEPGGPVRSVQERQGKERNRAPAGRPPGRRAVGSFPFKPRPEQSATSNQPLLAWPPGRCIACVVSSGSSIVGSYPSLSARLRTLS
jgi:hypothetical protein